LNCNGGFHLVKKSYLIGFIIFLLMAMTGIALLAQNSVDDRGDTNDPATNPRANACYAGGSLDDSCDADWKWVCGWGIIRVESGLLNRAVLSSECQALMPALATAVPPSNGKSKTSNTGIPAPVVTEEAGGGVGNDSIFVTATPPI
jgi:hypothetical protein